MIKLDTPIVIYPDTYDGLFIVRGEFDMRTKTTTLYLAPARSDADNIYLGVKETIAGEVQYRFPELIRSIKLQQDLMNPNPLVEEIISEFAAFLERIEGLVIATQSEPSGLASTPHQIGTTQWSLASTYEPNASRPLAVVNLDPEEEEEGNNE